jgi:tight adherence protein B
MSMGADMDSVFYGFAVLVFAAVILTVEGAWLWYADNYGAAAKRIARRLRMMSERDRGGERISILKQRRHSRNEDLDRLLHRLALAHWIDRRLLQAGLRYTVAQFLAASVLLLGVGAALMQASRLPLAVHVLVAALCGAVPYWLLMRERRRRLHRIEAQLPEVADFLARAMRAGHSFNNVLQMAGTDMPEPLAGEFRIAHEEINYGVPMHEALTNLAARVPLADMGYLVIAVLIQREAGGNLAEILGNISHIIRQRLKLLAQVRVLSAEGRMSAWVLALLPFGAASAMMLTNLSYISLMWTDPLGIRMSWYGAGMLVTGAIWLRKLTHIRV